MEMTPILRDYLRSLNASSLSGLEVETILDIMLELDPHCGPAPTTKQGKLIAAQVFVRLMQGETCTPASWHPKTWRAGHAR